MIKKRILLAVSIILSIYHFGVSVHPQTIADITNDVETDFGTYHPYLVTITPAASTYSVNSNFDNVSNFQDLSAIFSESDLNLLRNNYFAVKPTEYKEIFDVYKDCKEREIPIFVTTDAMLHTFHIIYDYALRALEVQKFAQDLDALNKAMLDATEQLYHSTTNDSLKDIIKKSVAYFGVATKLKDEYATVPAFVGNLVQAEIDLITAHEGFANSPIFNDDPIEYIEDYSQYIPRGHYTRNDTLRTYFKSMMWLGRMTFRLEPDTTEAGKQKGKEETLQAILIAKTLNELTVNGEPALTVWERMYDPTVFFVGKSDDLDIYDYTELIKEVYGENYPGLTVEDFAEGAKLTEFIEKAKALEDPLINSNWITDQQDFENATKGFRFMGQRFIPDSYMFQQLVYDKVLLYQGSGNPFTLVPSNVGPIRGFPRGLDALTVLGSEEAENIILEEGDHEYDKYEEQLNKLKEEFQNLEDPVWAQNLYWNWLYTLMPLLEPKGEGYPPFMQNTAWCRKQIFSALASWGELRHDTILYAKQSYTSFATGVPVPLDFTFGYVEPNPHLFARLASLANLMHTGLSGRGLLLDEFKSKLVDFESLLLGLKIMAEKELTNQDLALEEYDTIWTIGERLENLLSFSEELSGQITDETDEGMAVVADVHTDSNTQQVLEEGVGYPFEIYVIAKINDTITLTRGGMFSYYEFKHPMNDRLTDEGWQEKLKSGNPPELAPWTETFIDHGQSFINQNPYHAFLEDETLETVSVDLFPERVEIGDTLTLNVKTTAYSDSTLIVRFYQNSDTEIASTILFMDSTNNFYQGFYSGQIATDGWTEGTITMKILHGGDLLHTHWFEIHNLTGIGEEENDLPKIFVLHQNYPNPFNPFTTIRFDLPKHAHVSLTIYNILGQRIKTLFNGETAAGSHAMMWDGKDDTGSHVSSGIYIYKIVTEEFVQTRKMFLMR
jgi:hypothetical protein